MSVIKLKNVRIAFCDALFEAETYQDSKPAYSSTFLVPKGTPQAKMIVDAAIAALEAKNPGKGKALFESVRNNSNRCNVQDGDLQSWEGAAGNWCVRAKRAETKGRVPVFDRDKSPIQASDGKVYSGCNVNAHIEFFGYDKPAKGVSAGLTGVQFSSDNDSFAGGTTATPDDFDDLGDIGEDALATATTESENPAAGLY